MSHASAGVLIACTVGNFVSVTPALHAVFGLFLIPIATELHWPRAQVSGVLSVIALITALCYPWVGRLADRIGTRRLVLLGNLAFALCLALLATANGNVVQFYLLFALLAAASSLPSSMMFTKVLTGWFDRSRGAMLGIAGGIGNGAGSTLMPVMAAALMAQFGWRGAFVGIGLLVAVLGFPLMFFLLKDAPRGVNATATEIEPVSDGLTLSEALRTGTFWLVLIAIALGAGCLTALFAHVIPVLADRGIDTGRATAVVSLFALVCAAWQIAMGWLLDRSRSPRIAAPFYLIPIAGLALLQWSTALPALLAAGALLGIGLGTAFGALPYFVSRYFGRRAYGAISGLMYSVVIFAQGTTPFLMDSVYDHFGSYRLAIYAIGAAMVISTLLMTRLPGYTAASPADTTVLMAAV